MTFNFSTGFITYFLCSLVILTFVFFLIIQNFYKKRYSRYRHSLILLLLVISVFLWCIGQALANLLLSSLIFKISLLFLIPWSFLLIFILDLMSRDSIDPIKTLIITIISFAYIISMTDPNAVIFFTSPLGETGMAWSGNFEVTGAILAVFQNCFWTYYLAKIHWNTPTQLKKYSRLFVGSFGCAWMVIISVLLGLDKIILGTDAIFLASGVIVFMIALSYEPKLAFILPFKALTLTVIDLERGGLPLFTHNWNPRKDYIDDSLFSGMMTGMSNFMKETVQRGNIREIQLDDAVLIIQRAKEYPLVSVLVTTKSSVVLRNSLNSFLESFMNKFNVILTNTLMINTNQFEAASELVVQAFPFIPES